MDELESTVLDGRYHVLRRIGGTEERPLVVASDLHRGGVVCLRLWPFNSAMVGPAALPGLSPLPLTGNDEPLLPHDFGVDGGIAYTVRPYQTTTSLAERLGADPAVEPVAAVRLIRRAAQALLSAHDQGFGHGHLRAEHVLVAPGDRLYVCGFDQPDNRYSVAREQHDVRALLALLDELLAAGLGKLSAASGEAGPVGAARGRAASSPGLQDVLATVDRWLVGEPPTLAVLLRALQRAERRLTGVHPARDGATVTGRAVVALGWRLRHLGPLLQPYLLALALLAGTVLFLAGALGGSPAEARRLLIYAVAPTATAVFDASPTPHVLPPTAYALPPIASATATASPARQEAIGPNDQPSPATATAPKSTTLTSAPALPDRRVATDLATPSPAPPRAADTRARPTAVVRRADSPARAEPTREAAPTTLSPLPTATARRTATAGPGRSDGTPTPEARPEQPAVSTPTARPFPARTSTPARTAATVTSRVETPTPARHP